MFAAANICFRGILTFCLVKHAQILMMGQQIRTAKLAYLFSNISFIHYGCKAKRYPTHHT